MVAVLLSGGVLLGMGAISIDVGRVYVERRIVQNGADSGALAVAIDCAADDTCDTSVDGAAQSYAGMNADDGLTGVETVCGAGATTLTGGCPEQAGADLTRCPDEPTVGFGWVRVATATQSPSGPLLPPSFVQALPGMGGYAGTQVRACAQAVWGAPSRLIATLPVTISKCEWEAAVGSPAPSFPSSEVTLKLHDPAGAAKDDVACPATAPGGDLPGGFGWLDGEADCSADVTEDGIGDPKTGVAVPNECKDELPDLVGSVIYVPVFRDLEGTGTTADYFFEGFAAFHLTGYSLTGTFKKTSDVGVPLCKGSEKCIYGWFTTGLSPAGGTIGDGPDMGVRVVSLAG